MPERPRTRRERATASSRGSSPSSATGAPTLAADLAGTSPHEVRAQRAGHPVMCSGRVDPQFVLEAFAKGADGVLIGGCHPGDCHYQEGNYKALRRFRLLQRVLRGLGIEEERIRLEWISASEGDKLRDVMNDMVATAEGARARCDLDGPGRGLPARAGRSGGGDGMSDKPKVAFYWCSSCGGCEEAVVDLAEEILDVVAAVDIVFWPVALDFKKADVEAMADGSIAGRLRQRGHPHHRAGGDGPPAAAQGAGRWSPSAPAPTWAASPAWPTSGTGEAIFDDRLPQTPPATVNPERTLLPADGHAARTATA